MNKYFLLLLIAFLSGCSSNTEEPSVDCSASDLDISVVSSVKSDCDQPGSITVEASGGEGEYAYSIDGESFQDSETFDDLFAGSFSLIVKDELGCAASTLFTLESEPTGITLSLSSVQSSCGGQTGSISAEASGGTGELSYVLGDGQFGTSNEFTNLGPGEYEVRVQDEEGCQVSKSIRVSTNASLSMDIMPIIESDCSISGCHNGSQSPRLITESEVIQNASRIKSETQAGTMPRDGSLSQSQIDLIACWVDDGANDN